MTSHTNTVAVPLEDIYIDRKSPKITTPIPCPRYLLSERDFLEYSMGFSRGEMDALLDTEKSFNITVREDVCESLFKHGWGIAQSVDEIQHIVDFFWSNYKCGVKKRVWYTEVFPTQPSYTYRLWYNENRVQLHLPNGQPCISDQTLVTTSSTTLHPLLAVVLASDFAIYNIRLNLENPIEKVLVSLAMVMARPLWLSWFPDCPPVTTLRPQPKAVRDLPEHLSTD